MTLKTEWPTCEVCQKEPATSFSWFSNWESPISEPNGAWKLAGDCTIKNEDYYIKFDRFFDGQRGTAEWLAHLNGKTWMNWHDFAKMMGRFTRLTDTDTDAKAHTQATEGLSA